MTVRPLISVVICTRQRPDDLTRCLTSLSLQDYPRWEVLVVDQSDGLESEAVVKSFSYLPNCRYLPRPERGQSRARNVGLEAAAGDIVAFLDDDCTVGPTWLARVALTFDRHPGAGIVFGTVRSAVALGGQYVPVYLVPMERVMHGARAATRAHGIGAAMYVRRAATRVVGHFDVNLGTGSRFLASEDWDYAFRMLASGFPVVETPEIVVDHYGGRAYDGGAAARLLRGNAYSHGTVHMKLLRCGRPVGLLLIASEIYQNLRIAHPLAPLFGRGPTNLGRIPMYFRGLIASFSAPVDRRRLVYAD